MTGCSSDSARKRLLDAGRELFAARGYAAVTVREITARARVNQAMVSYYFGGKEGLYGEVLAGEFAHVVALPDNADLPSLSPRGRILALASAMDRLHRERPWIASLIHQEMVWPTRFLEESVVPALVALSSFLRETISEGVKQGEFRAGLDVALSVYVFAAVVNYRHIFRPLISRILEDQGPDPDPDRLLDIFLRGVEQ